MDNRVGRDGGGCYTMAEKAVQYDRIQFEN